MIAMSRAPLPEGYEFVSDNSLNAADIMMLRAKIGFKVTGRGLFLDSTLNK